MLSGGFAKSSTFLPFAQTSHFGSYGEFFLYKGTCLLPE